MKELIRNIVWQEMSLDISRVLGKDCNFEITPLDSGLEADVYRIITPRSSLVLKIWNRSSKPDVSTQYKLLSHMYNSGANVSNPYAWGMDVNNNQLLLTSYDGIPIHKVNKNTLTEIANHIVDIHRIPLGQFNDAVIPQYNFIDYFFPEIERHSDIQELVVRLVNSTTMNQTNLIHGDYNLGNILGLDGKYTIIDWTNIQLGDPRYDLAWSIILMWIYVSERHYSTYRSLIIKKTNNTEEEMELFEAIACLRWVLLNRITKLPKKRNTLSTVLSILQKNKFLHID